MCFALGSVCAFDRLFDGLPDDACNLRSRRQFTEGARATPLVGKSEPPPPPPPPAAAEGKTVNGEA
jgi:hypothetical protein